jgi:predicted DsbA family dithiol-disulfide isomerase
VRLRKVKAQFGDRVDIVVKSFPLRPEPDPSVTFKGTSREEGWRRASAMGAADGAAFRLWDRDDYATWSLPALEAAKCAALQGPAAFDRMDEALFRAFFQETRNISRREELLPVAEAAGLDLPRFLADFDSGRTRAQVVEDYVEAVRRYGIRGVPTVIFNDSAKLVGAHPLDAYLAAVARFLDDGPTR